YEIDFRLAQKERNYEDAVIAAHGLTFEAIADDGLIVAGQPIKVSVATINHGPSDVTVARVETSGFAGPASCTAGAAKKDAFYSCSADLKVPTGVKPTEPYFHDNYWKHPENLARNDFDPAVPFGIAFAPSPFRVTYHVKAGSIEVTKDIPLQFRYSKDLYLGDKRMELNVVPALSVRMSPGLAVVPATRAAADAKPVDREIHVTVTNGTKGAAKAS